MQAIDTTKAKPGAQGAQPAPAIAAKPEGAAEVKLQPLKRGELELAEMRQNAWRIVAPVGARPEQLDLHAQFWNLAADELRSGDAITVLAHDRSWVALYVVLDAGPGNAAVKMTFSAAVPLRSAGAAKQLPAGWVIERTGPSEPDGFAARGPDGKRILNSGMPYSTHEECRRGLLDHAIFAEEKATRYLP